MKKNKKRNRLNVLRGIIIIFTLIVLVLGSIGYFIYVKYYSNKFVVKDYEKNITINYLEEYNPSFSVCYGNDKKCEIVEPIVQGEVNTKVLGEYLVKYNYKYKDNTYSLEQLVKVADIVGPEINIKNENELLVCPNGKVINLNVELTDNYDEELDAATTEYKDGKLYVSAKDKSDNITTKELIIEAKDSEGPVIKIEGSKSLTVTTGTKYEEKGATAIDACDGDVEVTISGEVNPNKQGKYEVVYTATDSANNTTEAKRTVTVKDKVAGEKIVYLTFDDGPSAYTAQLLDVLKKYNVKVTFFVTGKGDDAIIKRTYDEGHQIGLHTYSHDYKQVYASQEAYFEDLNKISNRVKNITGYESHIIRFPGGTSNSVSKISMKALAKEVVKRGYYYFDWNVSSGDAGGTTTSDGVYYNVINYLKSGTSVVLQHDVKKYSVDAVEKIIQYGLENGYTFERLEESSPAIRHGAGH